MSGTITASTLAQMQFALPVSFPFIVPLLTIGLASRLMVRKTLRLTAGRDVHHQLFRCWPKIFAIIFCVGAVSGIDMVYGFGSDRAVFSD